MPDCSADQKGPSDPSFSASFCFVTIGASATAVKPYHSDDPILSGQGHQQGGRRWQPQALSSWRPLSPGRTSSLGAPWSHQPEVDPTLTLHQPDRKELPNLDQA